MKRIENKGYGLIGIKVELSFQELIVLKERAEMLKRLSVELSSDIELSKRINTSLLDVHAFISKLTIGVETLEDAEHALFAPEEADVAISDTPILP